jgi:hypothetical protein
MSRAPSLARPSATAVSENGHVVILDVSSSMASSAGTKTRIAHLREALHQVATPAHTLLAFASEVTPMASPADLPPPCGGTALHLGLDAAAKLNPAAVLVITDGEPNESRLAVAAAGRLRGRIDVIYCGDTNSLEAIGFCRLLARMGRGRCTVHDWRHAISIAAPMQQQLLDGPK